MDSKKLKELEKIALQVRKDCIETQYLVKSGHLGGSFSATEMLVYLYFEKMNLSPNDVQDLNRDVFVLSKGHASLGYYAVLGRRGYFELEELKTYRKINTRLQGHTHIDSVPGVECSTGSLGQGLSYGLGIALAKQKKGLKGKVYVMMGDGEMQEGQVWEALMIQSKLKLTNLIPIVDNNKLQLDDEYVNIMGDPNYKQRFEAFGLNVIEINGNSFEEIDAGLMNISNMKPNIIVANTKKGAGINFMEDKVPWHSKKLNEQEYNQALEELAKKEVALNE